MLTGIITGILAGWIAGKLMDSRGGVLRNLFLGLIGGAVGGWLCGLFNLNPGAGFISSLIVSAAGACLCVWIGRKLFH